MKTHVLIVSRTFPKKHPKAGQPTYFDSKILLTIDPTIHAVVELDGEVTTEKKLTTIRSNYELWKKRIDEVNQGIAIAKGEYMALFNNDAFAESTWLAELLRTADADPKIFAVSSLMLRFYEPELADDAGDYVTILGFACKRGDGLKASRYTKPCRIFSACGGAALYRKSILDKIGVFDELFFAYYEDVDLSWRANNFGYKNVYCPTARCRHICGATTGAVRYNPFKSIQSGRNSILLPYKNQPLLMMLLNLIPMVLGYLLKVVMFRFRGFGNDYAKGFHEAWVALPKLNKPKFHWKNLPNYIWVECSLIVGLFRYLIYRIQRALKVT